MCRDLDEVQDVFHLKCADHSNVKKKIFINIGTSKPNILPMPIQQPLEGLLCPQQSGDIGNIIS